MRILLTCSVTLLAGCASLQRFDHQVERDEPHAILVIYAPPTSVREAAEAMDIAVQLNESGKRIIVEVEKIDGIFIPYNPDVDQSFRIQPGTHTIRYRTTVLKSRFNNLLGQRGGYGASTGMLLSDDQAEEQQPTRYVHATKSYEEKEIDAQPGHRYLLEGLQILEEKIE